MIRYAVRLDRLSAALVGGGLVVFLIMALSEIVNQSDGLTSSLSPYLELLIGVAWAAPMLTREVESGSASWAWGMGVPRRRWLAARAAPLAAGCVVTGCALGGLVMLSQVRWFPSMWQDKVTPALVASAFPSVVAFCLLSGALGLAAAALTTRLIPAITVTFAAQVALSYAGPTVAVRLAPSRVAPAAAVHSGHVLSEHTAHGIALVTYVPNSDYWPVVLIMSVFLLILAVGLSWLAITRIARLGD